MNKKSKTLNPTKVWKSDSLGAALAAKEYSLCLIWKKDDNFKITEWSEQKKHNWVKIVRVSATGHFEPFNEDGRRFIKSVKFSL